jgi:2,4-dienoyl-CoA reductase-like NADH-dependent reductase (Old Yellow Enzyme family)
MLLANMPEPSKFVRIPSLKTASDFRRHLTSLGLDLPCEENIQTGPSSPLLQPVTEIRINGKQIGNRYAVQPMEGWDGTSHGGITDDVRRRWRRFGESGAKLICGGEAMAVRPDGRANPNQLILSEETLPDMAELCRLLTATHRERYGRTDDLVIGFQLTHSGRFCKPHDKFKLEPKVAYRHPLLDRRFGVTSDAQVFTDEEISDLVRSYVQAAAIAFRAGADFVDIKHCHGYLLHEFLSAYTRPGPYGGSFENRTRILREIVHGIRASGNPIELGVRLSAFDTVPFKPDSALSQPGRPGPGIPDDYPVPYRYAFGAVWDDPLRIDLTETMRFVELCAELGVKILNLSAGSPYYNPHIQRPAAYPPSDGYQPPEDPLVGVARQVNAVRQVREALRNKPKVAGRDWPIMVGSAYSYLQEYLPHVAQGVLRQGWADLVGLGRMVLSYPTILADATSSGVVNRKTLCRTFSDCTTGPRNGLVSGCYPLDPYYASRPEAQQLKDRQSTSQPRLA